MSLEINIEFNCMNCEKKIQGSIFRSIWIEDKDNRDLILNDKINLVKCPNCSQVTFVDNPFLCTNIGLGVAIWYEPFHDSGIDRDVKAYVGRFGKDHFYATAPRIQNWEEFKNKIIEMEGLAKLKVKENLSFSSNEKKIGVIESLSPKRISNTWFENWRLNKLKKLKTRIAYGSLPFILIFILSIINFGRFPDSKEIVAIYLIITLVSTWVLTIIHEFVPWKKRSKLFRNYVFFSGCWIIGVMVYRELLFDRYNSDMERSLLVALLPTVLFGIALYVYNKYVKEND